MELRNKIKQKIKSIGTLKSFSENHEIRIATLSDFLSGKQDIQTSTLTKILEGVNFSISEILSRESFPLIQKIFYNNFTYNIGDRVRLHKTTFYLATDATHKIKYIFGNDSIKCFIMENIVTGEFNLILL